MFLTEKNLSPEFQKEIWQILLAADQEFVPPLSARNNTTQQSFAQQDKHNSEPTEYFNRMLDQSFILSLEKNTIVGFLTYIPDHLLHLSESDIVCDYISTIIVSKEYRNRGLTSGMYQALFENRGDKNFATRTWSSNDAHIHLLKKLNFDLVETRKNDRGAGIDTVYYLKRAERKTNEQ